MSIEESLDKFQIMRRERIKWVAEKLKEIKEVDLEVFLALLSFEQGVRPKTGREYLRDLEILGKIEIKDGRIKWKDEQSTRYGKVSSDT